MHPVGWYLEIDVKGGGDRVGWLHGLVYRRLPVSQPYPSDTEDRCDSSFSVVNWRK